MAERRPSWRGHLKLSLVTCPVRLYNATTRANTVSFHFLNPKTKNRIQMRPFDPDTGPVERADLVKGYEFEKDRYVIVTEDDLDKVRLPSSKVLEVERFVPAGEIDPVYLDNPYWLVPDGPIAEEAFAVIRESMRQENKAALAHLVLSRRERAVLIQPRERGMLLTTLRTSEEVRLAGDLFDDIGTAKVDPRMVEIAGRIIEQSAGEFEPETLVDHYEQALHELIDARMKGEEPTVAEEPPKDNVIDLMAALKSSLGVGAKSGSPAKKAANEDAAPAKARAKAKPAKKPAAAKAETAPKRKAGGRK